MKNEIQKQNILADDADFEQALLESQLGTLSNTALTNYYHQRHSYQMGEKYGYLNTNKVYISNYLSDYHIQSVHNQQKHKHTNENVW